jgi:ferredoxin-nitrite reductase
MQNGAHESEHQSSPVRSRSASHRTHPMISVSARPPGAEPIFCPSLFTPTVATDGLLTRVKTPGGWLNQLQALVFADFADQLGATSIQVTNRANLQLVVADITKANYSALQEVGLAAKIAVADRFRNIMASPTAGIDPQMLVDTRSLVTEIDQYLSQQTDLAGLSGKFSIGIDGGESLSIGDRPNDILLIARPHGIRLVLGLSGNQWLDTGLLWGLDQATALVATLVELYLRHSHLVPVPVSKHRRSSLPRWRHLIEHFGLDWLRSHCPAAQQINSPLDLPATTTTHHHLGIHDQLQVNHDYLGIVLSLGQITTEQLRGLASITDQYGSGEIRLTPWQNIVLPNITQVATVIKALSDLGLTVDAHHPAGSIAACRGTLGCAAAITNSQQDAWQLIQQLNLHSPVQIHISSCDKGCAYPVASDLALKGTSDGYEIYLYATGQIFGRLLYPAMSADRALSTVQKILAIYERQHTTTTFREFTSNQDIATLRQLFDA